ncbi:MAG: DHH family phosphoesterase [Thermoplasmatota archaeon]
MNELTQLSGKGLLIHHWDTDGICSATLILEKMRDSIVSNRTPTLGNYYLTAEELKECEGFDFIIIVDMNLPEENINALAKNTKLYIFDHHLGKEIKTVFHHNPIIKGNNPDEYPSASYIINDYLQKPMNLPAILGIIGDHEQKIKNNPFFNKKITDFCTQQHLSFEHLIHMTYLIDSNYKLGDKKAVEQAPHYILENPTIAAIMENKQWQENLDTLDREIVFILTEPVEHIDTIIRKNIHTKSNIISTVTRKLAWSHNKTTIVVNTGYFDTEDQLYVRTIDIDLKPMIQKGKEYGYRCGGKKEVLGAIIPKTHTQSFIDEIIRYLTT